MNVSVGVGAGVGVAATGVAVAVGEVGDEPPPHPTIKSGDIAMTSSFLIKADSTGF